MANGLADDLPHGHRENGPSRAEEDRQNVQAAAELHRQRPAWAIGWDTADRRFTAARLYRGAGTPTLTAPTIDDLAALIDQAEQNPPTTSGPMMSSI